MHPSCSIHCIISKTTKATGMSRQKHGNRCVELPHTSERHTSEGHTSEGHNEIHKRVATAAAAAGWRVQGSRSRLRLEEVCKKARDEDCSLVQSAGYKAAQYEAWCHPASCHAQLLCETCLAQTSCPFTRFQD